MNGIINFMNGSINPTMNGTMNGSINPTMNGTRIRIKSYSTSNSKNEKQSSQKEQENPSSNTKDNNGKKSEKKSSPSKYVPLLLGAFATYIALGQLHESTTDPIPNESWFDEQNRKCKEAIIESYEYFMNPPTKKLLPPLPPQLHRDYTLCIELTDALTHLVWDIDVGWRVALRPGVKRFLYTLHQYFELVVFTNTPSHLASPVIDAVDNYGLFHYRLYREHHRLDKDTHLKDLSFLNRDLSKVIVVDTTKDSFATHPENGLLIKKWTGEKGDKVLYDYTAFLQELLIFASTQKITDLRPLLNTIRSIDENDTPKAWATHKENIKTLIKQRSSTPASTDNDTTIKPSNSSLFGMLSSTVQALFGASSLEGGSALTRGLGKTNASTAIDRIEQYCADTRKMLDKELLAHEKYAETHRKEQMEMIKKQIEDMKNSDIKLIDYITGNIPQAAVQGGKQDAANA